MSELSGILADQIARLLGDTVSKDLLDKVEQGTWPAELWRALEENGLTQVLVPEDKGGAGGQWSDAAIVLRAAGRHAAPVPLAETVLAAWLASLAGLEVPLGPLTFAPVRRTDSLALSRAGGGLRLSGSAGRVPWGGRAGHLLALAPLDGRPHLALVAIGAAGVTADKNMAGEPRDHLGFDNAAVLAAAPAPAQLGGEGFIRWGALIRSAQMAGGLDCLLEQTVRYANERSQFGRPIGKFQAIQQQLAVLASHTAAAGMAALVACRAAETDDPGFEIAVAKVRVGEAAGAGCAIAHQVHGAMGFTYEHALHFTTRRLWSWRSEFGNESDWSVRLGREVAGRGADALWRTLTQR